ncbi:MAG: hypothetical protein HY928_11805 [Elusimicrobia bacterium]|nr:hypothetical protein [Elusimicrobiota bacterium]
MPIRSLHIDCDDDACRRRFLAAFQEAGIHPESSHGSEVPPGTRLLIVCGADAAALAEAVRRRRASLPAGETAILATMRAPSYGDIPRVLDAGADDCLQAPFANSLLVARARSLLRRMTPQPDAPSA